MEKKKLEKGGKEQQFGETYWKWKKMQLYRISGSNNFFQHHDLAKTHLSPQGFSVFQLGELCIHSPHICIRKCQGLTV